MIETFNKSMVGVRGDHIVSPLRGFELTRDEALNMAAWIVVLADPVGDDFNRLREAIEQT